ncbi:GNAT family N-acetyltransferase [Candidatus Poribacteria bacterium]|nr:GNAT family N-acetyltransferase [Candidatus Poribacteria bacterium]
MDFTRINVPLPEGLIPELTAFWEEIFETSYEDFKPIFAGDEIEDNEDILYLMRQGEDLAGTSHLTVGKAAPRLGGLGEVATPPAFRRQGIAAQLCEVARDDFRGQGGEAFFLGTGNPAAARIYYRLGWRKLAGANVMALIESGSSPEAFLVDYFREAEGQTTIVPGTWAQRIPMIPLIVCPHDWQVLDANAGIFSTRYAVQSSCMGLYPKYDALVQQQSGTWFGAQTNSGHLIGLATARLDGTGVCHVDGFTHQCCLDAWGDLIQAAMDWGANRGATEWCGMLSVEDEDKQSLFESLGFEATGEGEAFTLGERPVPSVLLKRSA